MCQRGINLGVSVTRHRADLRALARKASKNTTPELMEQIRQKKIMITDGIKYQTEHLANCKSCSGG